MPQQRRRDGLVIMSGMHFGASTDLADERISRAPYARGYISGACFVVQIGQEAVVGANECMIAVFVRSTGAD